MRESGEPMEFGIYDLPRCFQGLLVKGVMGQRGLKWKPEDLVSDLGIEFQGIRTIFEDLEIFQFGFFLFQFRRSNI